MSEFSVLTERDIISKLLKLYKKHPCLWNTLDPMYANKDARQEALEVLLVQWQKLDKNASIDSLKYKLENMRSVYRRERKKVESSLSTSVTKEVYKPTLWYYDQLTFLDDSSQTKTDSNSDKDDEDGEIPKKRNRIHRAGSQKKQERSTDPPRVALTSNEELAADSYGRAIGSQLKELPKLQRCLAEKLMSEIIFYGKMDQLSLSTAISLNNSNLEPPPLVPRPSAVPRHQDTEPRPNADESELECTSNSMDKEVCDNEYQIDVVMIKDERLDNDC